MFNLEGQTLVERTSRSGQATLDLAAHLVDHLRAEALTLATAESCTGGLVSAAITDIAGASDVYDRGFVTYSNRAKNEMLNVPRDLIEKFGAVSAEVARAMADGAIKNSTADISVAITGIAGPGGGTATKPVGLVFIGVGKRGHASTVHQHIFNDASRSAIRQAALAAALTALSDSLGISQ